MTEQIMQSCGTRCMHIWTAAKIRSTNRKAVKGCRAEGHVNHVLSARMSSRPMGWSRTGVDKMAHLQAYYWNGGDMLCLWPWLMSPGRFSLIRFN
ncbi:MAG TPA: UPF0236 family protein [Candidatus Blautia faecavium]|uniref:UPF0236 family protein n=1 Tax=Candidatus Blautia faecavium TaxID=2838487 RepID=A0A9D2LW36_9FIRM|nr:UPF0236 family protein [Candidatus Blautia faecavium]